MYVLREDSELLSCIDPLEICQSWRTILTYSCEARFCPNLPPHPPYLQAHPARVDGLVRTLFPRRLIVLFIRRRRPNLFLPHRNISRSIRILVYIWNRGLFLVARRSKARRPKKSSSPTTSNAYTIRSDCFGWSVHMHRRDLRVYQGMNAKFANRNLPLTTRGRAILQLIVDAYASGAVGKPFTC